jgi:hypothetical protein
MTTKVKTAFEKDFETAQATLTAYADLKTEKATIDASMKEAKAKLEAFAKKYRNKFDENGNLQMDGGYLHFGQEGKVVIDEEVFSWKNFLKKFPKLVKFDFNRRGLQAALTDGDARKAVVDLGVDMTFEQKFDIKVKGEKED